MQAFLAGQRTDGSLSLKHGAQASLMGGTICRAAGTMKTKVPTRQWRCCRCFCTDFDPYCIAARQVKLAVRKDEEEEQGRGMSWEACGNTDRQ